MLSIIWILMISVILFLAIFALLRAIYSKEQAQAWLSNTIKLCVNAIVSIILGVLLLGLVVFFWLVPDAIPRESLIKYGLYLLVFVLVLALPAIAFWLFRDLGTPPAPFSHQCEE